MKKKYAQVVVVPVLAIVQTAKNVQHAKIINFLNRKDKIRYIKKGMKVVSSISPLFS